MSSPLLAACTALGSLWLAGLWQGTAVLLCTGLLLRLQPTLAPRIRYAVCCVGYGLATGLPLLLWLHGGGSRPPNGAHGAPVLLLDRRWASLLGGLSLLASLAAGVRLAAGLWAVRGLLRSATPVPASFAEPYAELLRQAGRGPIALYRSEKVTAPVALGYRHPAIVLPRSFPAGLGREAMEQALRHEAEHLRRRDDWAALLLAGVRCLLPLQPALLGLERQLRAAREMACDDAVLSAAPARAYAANLLELARSSGKRSPLRMVLHLHGPYAELRRRIDHILAARAESAGLSRRSVLGAAACLLLLPAMLIESPALIEFRAQALTEARTEPAAFPLPQRPRELAAARHAVVPPRLLRVSHTIPRHSRRARPAPVLLATATSRSVEDAPAPVLVLWPGRGGRAVFVFAVNMGDPRQGFVLLQL